MKQKPNLQLRKIGKRYIIVDNDSAVNLTGVYTLNEVSARIWEAIGETADATPEKLATLLCNEYEVDHSTALADVTRQIEEWQRYGLLEQ